MVPVLCALLATRLLPPGVASANNGPPDSCVSCHDMEPRALAPGHRGLHARCTACHGGLGSATSAESAHRGMVSSPGELANAERSCGACHTNRVHSVRAGLMHSGAGMTAVTREVFAEADVRPHSLQSLGDSPADQLLRKLCAGCHLGQPRRKGNPDPLLDRGGGCLACHRTESGHGDHPRLSATVGDERCLGCHSRSSRISLSYAGIAEVDHPAPHQDGERRLGRLADGRLVERLSPDVHHRAGLGCTDCHTARELMGNGEAPGRGREALDVSCEDCHANREPTLPLAEWPGDMLNLRARVPFAVDGDSSFLQTRRMGTPLWNVRISGERLLLYPKGGGRPMEIPTACADSRASNHARLTCEACHAQWAPQCFGCHLEYRDGEKQWDHVARRVTPGRWRQRRWGIRNEAPVLGVRADGRVATFAPGMVLSVEHPRMPQGFFARRFAALSPHTTGKARSCSSCHASAFALGLGSGELARGEEGWNLRPTSRLLQDGLAADAWTTLSGGRAGETTYPGDRALDKQEILRILNAPMEAAKPAGSRDSEPPATP